MSRAISMNDHKPCLLEVGNLKTYFPVTGGVSIPYLGRKYKYVRAVDGVTIQVHTGETVAVVGESGCGKTTLAKTILGLAELTNGSVELEGRELDRSGDLKKRFKVLQMVFQDPDSSLDPTMNVRDIVAEPLIGLTTLSSDERARKVVEVLRAVGLGAEFLDRLPRQLSGGQKQRVNVARALVTEPKLVILDEPTSALDASVQAQILTLLVDLQEKYGLSYLIITHNIAVAEFLSDRIYVMYAGRIVEYGPTKSVIDKPRHPYTIALIASAPIPDPRKRNLMNVNIIGEAPSVIAPPSGCRFHPRCPYAKTKCHSEYPELEALTSDHSVSCHFVAETA